MPLSLVKPESPPIVGIDLGTTYSLVAVMEGGHPVVIPNALGDALTPSVVSIDAQGIAIVGEAARARAVTHPAATASLFKRDMGTDRLVELDGRPRRPEELSALVLAELKRDAECYLGCEIREAVITVPAYFGQLAREATRSAGEMAGFRVERIINEPTAAALSYGFAQGGTSKIVVLDLGGGTFDVSVLESDDGIIEIRATSGDSRLGGEDFLEAMLGLVRRRCAVMQRPLGADPVSEARLRQAGEAAKRRLSRELSTRLVVAGLAAGEINLEVTRAQVTDAWAELLERIRRPILRALRDASLAPEAIDRVLLVGGASRMPCFQDLCRDVFRREPEQSLPPDEVVATGAAIQAALKNRDAAVNDLVVTDVAPFSLGVSVSASVGSRKVSGVFSPVIDRGTVIPASRVESFHTSSDGQREIVIDVYQGEHATCDKNTPLGSYTIPDIPPARAGQERVDVCFSYDLSGLLIVETTVASTGKKHELLIERTPGTLSPTEVAAIRVSIERTKLHPRDSLPNTTALARAEALYLELIGERRRLAGALIAELRASLETQDPAIIAEARGRLLELVDESTGP